MNLTRRRKPKIEKVATIRASSDGVVIEISRPTGAVVATIGRPSHRRAEQWLEDQGYTYEKDLHVHEQVGGWMKIDFDGAAVVQLAPGGRRGVRLR